MLRDEEAARAYVASLCSHRSFGKLERFVEALIAENARQNLISPSSVPNVWLRHIADSAQLLSHVSRETDEWADFGSGAGVPGLVIAIIRPQQKVTLIESRNLRIQWLLDMISYLNLTNCRVIGSDVRRIDTFAASVLSARAFAPLPRLIALCARFSTKETEWVLPKGRSAVHELKNLPETLRPMFHVEQSVTDAEAGIIIGKGQIAS